ncbi:winged helix-turn-helix domain-containing protein [Prescottella equi]|uniref:winged helix-turn-helix domain-containing protein n=1 Tax=Rhodococcus hoagii TaxID=43767 RepID=UPI00197FF708|nr:winged helix-turn-helix domain-containing protein [Prescottella equi]NKU91701.1 hypothetical protein [Prescottella equi]
MKTGYAVRPEIVRKVGATAAYLFAAIVEHSEAEGFQAGGHRWWRATIDDVADEIAVSINVVRRATRKLVAAGVIECATHELNGPMDRTLSYRPKGGVA